MEEYLTTEGKIMKGKKEIKIYDTCPYCFNSFIITFKERTYKIIHSKKEEFKPKKSKNNEQKEMF